jgi:DnaK suppressor protein
LKSLKRKKIKSNLKKNSMALKKQKKVTAKKPTRKTSRAASRDRKQPAVKKKTKTPSKKTAATPLKKTRTQPKKKTAWKKIPHSKPASGTLTKKIKKKPVQTTKKTKKPSTSRKPIAEKFEDQRNITLRKFLLNKRQDILREAKNEISKYIKGETRQLVESALDDGDWSVIDLSEDISLRQLSTHRENLLKIDAALRKLNEGTYGQCEECGEAINEERLKVMPFAIYCIDCQERLEELEKIEMEEGRY